MPDIFESDSRVVRCSSNIGCDGHPLSLAPSSLCLFSGPRCPFSTVHSQQPSVKENSQIGQFLQPTIYTMAILIHQSARLVLRRSIQRQHNLLSAPKRQKATAADKSIEKPSQPQAFKEKSTEVPTVRDNSPPPFPLPLWQRLGPVSDVFNAYGRTQRKRPWATQVGTSLVIYLCGDLAAQNIGGEDYNPWRTVRHLTIGAICSIPAYSWYALRTTHTFIPNTDDRFQVHVPQSILQLLLATTLPGYQSRREPDRLHAHFQQLLLRNAVPIVR